MAHLLHLNGQPGIGKSTLARRFAAAHPGTLNCDIDALRAMIGGWQDDVPAASRRARSAALAMITQYLSDGGDVVVPQLVARPDQLRRFEDAARSGGARYRHVLLRGDDELQGDDELRDGRDPGTEVPGSEGGHAPVATLRALQRSTPEELGTYRRGLDEVLRAFPDTAVVVSTDEERTYARLVEAVHQDG